MKSQPVDGFLAETDPEIAGYLTKRMLREVKRHRATKPYHAARTCKTKTCIWHAKASR